MSVPLDFTATTDIHANETPLIMLFEELMVYVTMANQAQANAYVKSIILTLIGFEKLLKTQKNKKKMRN